MYLLNILAGLVADRLQRLGGTQPPAENNINPASVVTDADPGTVPEPEMAITTGSLPAVTGPTPKTNDDLAKARAVAGPPAHQGDEEAKKVVVETKPGGIGTSSVAPDPIGVGTSVGQRQNAPSTGPSSVVYTGKTDKSRSEPLPSRAFTTSDEWAPVSGPTPTMDAPQAQPTPPPPADDPEVECCECWVKAPQSRMTPFRPGESTNPQFKCADRMACYDRGVAQRKAGMRWTNEGWVRPASQPTPPQTPRPVPPPITNPGSPVPVAPIPKLETCWLCGLEEPQDQLMSGSDGFGISHLVCTNTRECDGRSNTRRENGENWTYGVWKKADAPTSQPTPPPKPAVVPPAEPPIRPRRDWRKVVGIGALLGLLLAVVIIGLWVLTPTTPKTAAPSGPCLVLSITEDAVMVGNTVKWRCWQTDGNGERVATRLCADPGLFIWPDRAPFVGDRGYASIPDTADCRPIPPPKTASSK